MLAVRAAGRERAGRQGARQRDRQRREQQAAQPDDLWISEAYVDEGPTLKRFRPRAQGRACRIRKRTSHITVVESRERRRRRPAGQRAEGGAEKPAPEERYEPPRRRRQEDAKKATAPDEGEVLRQWVRRSTRTGSARHLDRLRQSLVRRQQQGRSAYRDYVKEDVAIRKHDDQGHGARRHLQGRDRAHARPRPRRHPHRASGHRHRPPRRRGRPHPWRPREADRQAGPAEHPRGQEPRDRRSARRAGRGRAALEPRLVPSCHAQVDADGDEVRRARASGCSARVASVAPR